MSYEVVLVITFIFVFCIAAVPIVMDKYDEIKVNKLRKRLLEERIEEPIEEEKEPEENLEHKLDLLKAYEDTGLTPKDIHEYLSKVSIRRTISQIRCDYVFRISFDKCLREEDAINLFNAELKRILKYHYSKEVEDAVR